MTRDKIGAPATEQTSGQPAYVLSFPLTIREPLRWSNDAPYSRRREGVDYRLRELPAGTILAQLSISPVVHLNVFRGPEGWVDPELWNAAVPKAWGIYIAGSEWRPYPSRRIAD